jgi:pimeloyl-ACP methyl ester carboxylesterase
MDKKISKNVNQYIFVLQGWGAPKELYLPIKNQLQNNYNVILFDMPAIGENKLNEVWHLDNWVNWVIDFIKSYVNENDKVILFGHSFGGRIIIKMLGQKKSLPFNISKIILCDSAGIKPKKNVKIYSKIYSYKLLKIFKKPLLFLSNIIFPYLNEKLKNYYQNVGSSDYKKLSNNMKKTFSNIVNEDLTKYLNFINIETLIIWGKQDKDTPISDAYVMNKMIKNSHLEILDNAMHYPFLEKPVNFAKILDKYL